MGDLVDSSGARSGLLSGRHRDAGGVSWASELIRGAASTVPLRCDVRSASPSWSDDWSVELLVHDRPLVLIDVWVDGAADGSFDRLEIRAARRWRSVTRDAPLFEPRPWIGAIRIASDEHQAADVAERLRQLVVARILDAACVVTVDGGLVRSPRWDVSLDAFHAALVGRCLYLSTMTLAA